MKRIVGAALAAVAIATSTPVFAADFILSNNNANTTYYNNFRLTFSDANNASASLFDLVGATSFTDNFFFSPGIPLSIGSGYATANSLTGLTFAGTPNGVSITGYALNDAIVAALTQGFNAADAATYEDAVSDLLGNLGAPVSFLAGQTSVDGKLITLDNVTLSGLNVYKITVNGTGTTSRSQFDGNVSLTAVPEPATWAMMLAGFGLIGFAMRRQRQSHPKVRFAF